MQSIEWRTENFKLKQQLRRLGLIIRNTTGDGNCLFRAVSDQIRGNESAHGEYRALAVRLVRENREDFEPFLEDDEPFDAYVRRMSTDAVWGGNMELQALSLALNVNISIHIPGSVWEIKNFDGVRTINLSYHLGEHYNSVRLADDDTTAPARPIPSLFQPAIPAELLDAEDRRELVEYLMTLIPGAEEGKLQLVIAHMFGTEVPPIEVVNEKCGAIANVYFNSSDEELVPKPSKKEEKKEESKQKGHKQKQKVETRPATLPRNNEKCWCGSNKKYKVCCKAQDAFREPEAEVAAAEAGISSLRI